MPELWIRDAAMLTDHIASPWILLVLWHVAISVIAFGAYGIDKRLATRNLRRIPEKRLQALSLLGGWPGSLAGQRFFRHKRAKRAFMCVFWGTAVAHIAALIALVWAMSG